MRVVVTTLSIADIDAARAAIADGILRTPAARSDTLSAITGADVWLKFENLQYVGSFKGRGARNHLLANVDEARSRGVVAMSAGNHAQAVARHAALLGVSSTIVMPTTTPISKVTRTETNGARVVLSGNTLEEAAIVAARIAQEEGSMFVPPYDDPLVVAGQGTCVAEFLEDVPPLDALVIPVGGGGLMAGSCIAARSIAPKVELIGVQSELFPSMLAATGRPVPTPPEAWGATIAEGIAVKAAGGLTTSIIAEMADDLVCVPERSIEEAVVLYLEVEKVVAEGAGAAGLAALLDDPDRYAGRRVGLIISGGNIDLRLLSSVIMRGLARTGRLARIVVEIDDTPGSLSDLTRTLGDAGGNIVEVTHNRAFGVHSARNTSVELLVETRDAAHGTALRMALREAGYPAHKPKDL